MPHRRWTVRTGKGDTVTRSAGHGPHDPRAEDPRAHGSSAAAPESLWRRLNAGLHEFYVAPYRRVFARAKRDEEDLFMMLVLSEALGLPNPASGMTLELLPEMLDRMHEWHTRQGLEHSPMDGLGCC